MIEESQRSHRGDDFTNGKKMANLQPGQLVTISQDGKTVLLPSGNIVPIEHTRFAGKTPQGVADIEREVLTQIREIEAGEYWPLHAEGMNAEPPRLPSFAPNATESALSFWERALDGD